MTIQELQFLKLLIALTRKSEQPFFYNPMDHSVVFAENDDQIVLCNDLQLQVNGIIKSLISKSYIEPVETHGLDYEHYCLTHKGLHPFQFSTETIIKFAIKSILIPIAVAFLTAIVTVA